MLVTIISQCEKKAHQRTRSVLDAFSERIGTNTWQTIITEQGLDALHTELRKTASKSTAVACHWNRSRTRTELLWIVGKKQEFNLSGYVPVNETEEDIEKFMDKKKWNSLEIMKHAVSISGLFHDFGKANDLFQQKIAPNHKGKNSEPYRHEWISFCIFDQLINAGDNDEDWLSRLENISSCSTELNDENLNFTLAPNITTYPPLAQLIAWLILSHHRLPVDKNATIEHIDEWLEKNLSPSWNSPQCLSDDWTDEDLYKTKKFSNGLPHLSATWRKHAIEWATSAKRTLKQSSKDYHWLQSQRFTTHISRMALMLADHSYSNKAVTLTWQDDNYNAYANSDRKTRQLKQRLDEHNIGVAHNAREIIKVIPRLKSDLPTLDLESESLLTQEIKKDSEHFEKFGWQNEALNCSLKLSKNAKEEGFFGVNMASTGRGKTISNAKILYALGSRRFNVALGLRTLTLQTGTAFREDVKIPEEQLAILVGGIAVKELYELYNTEDQESYSGSESEDLDIPEVHGKFKSHHTHVLHEWTSHDERIEKLLQAPVLVSTIDHLIPATEGIRGGKQIGPMLRLLTSDLILDEPDDFGLEDLPALCRLVNWAGMLGSKVLLSTATMPPSLVNALFRSYQQGRRDYLEVNGNQTNTTISCAWFDEYSSSHKSIADDDSFKKSHESFSKKRISKIKAAPVIRRGSLLSVSCDDPSNNQGVLEQISQSIRSGIETLHQSHKLKKDDKTLSVGLVRIANITSLVAISKLLLEIDAPSDTHIHYCVYHSHFPLAVRSHIERNLDKILNRKNEDSIWEHTAEDLAKHPNKNNHIFVVIASPVAEVGRDHDYDWAIVEPSSMRSIIQLAGRVLRHRQDKVVLEETPNILILQKNYKGLKGESPCFKWPGFESNNVRSSSSDLAEVLTSEQYEVIDSSARIEMASFPLNTGSYDNLVNLEHAALIDTLFTSRISADLWWKHEPSWCGNLQCLQRFRASAPSSDYCSMMMHEEDLPVWYQINHEAVRPYVKTDDIKNFVFEPQLEKGNSFWLDLAPQTIFTDLYQRLNSKGADFEFPELSKRFGTISLLNNNNSEQPWLSHPQLGTFKEII